MGFTNDDRILIENLYIFKGYGEKKLINEFPDKLGFKLTEQITELFGYFACLFLHRSSLHRSSDVIALKNFTVSDITL